MSKQPQSAIGRRREARKPSGSQEYEARRRELIEAAAAVFKEKGYEAATLNDIAERIGADRASLYYYVASKHELFEEAVKGVLESNLEEAERVLAGEGDARGKLQLIIERLISSYEENYPHTYLYIQEDMRRVATYNSDWSREMIRKTRRFESIVFSLVAAAVEEGKFRDDVSVDLAVKALFGMLNWTHRWFQPGRHVSGRELADAFTAIFLDGMSK
jgi:TetR/AcrR family transcriptional regulator, cholesterol catabolism regulator